MPGISDLQSAGQQNSDALMVAVLILVVIIVVLMMKWPHCGPPAPKKVGGFTPTMQMNPQWQLGSVSAGQAAFADTAIHYQPVAPTDPPSCVKPLVGQQTWDVDNGWSSSCSAPGQPPSSCGTQNADAGMASRSLAFINGGEGRY